MALDRKFRIAYSDGTVTTTYVSKNKDELRRSLLRIQEALAICLSLLDRYPRMRNVYWESTAFMVRNLQVSDDQQTCQAVANELGRVSWLMDLALELIARHGQGHTAVQTMRFHLQFGQVPKKRKPPFGTVPKGRRHLKDAVDSDIDAAF